jgi:hypothetical protein
MQKKHCIYLLAALFAFGCGKEKSIDTGDFNPIFIGTNCRISQVLTVDSASGIGLEAHNTFFNTAGNATTAEVYDSLTSTRLFASSFIYRGDTVFLENGQYFVNDASGRVKLFRALADPSDPFSDTVRIVFSYDTQGYLVKKEYYYFGLTAPLLRSNYTYSSGNLTKSVLMSMLPSPQVLVDAVAEYNNTQTARENMYLLPDGYFTAPYILAFNFGKRPANTIKKLTTKVYDNGMLTDSLVTNYKNYKFSRDGYMLELFAEGDFQDGIGIIDGKTKFKYTCR